MHASSFSALARRKASGYRRNPSCGGCVAQRESTSFTPRGSQVQSLSHPPFFSIPYGTAAVPLPRYSPETERPTTLALRVSATAWAAASVLLRQIFVESSRARPAGRASPLKGSRLTAADHQGQLRASSFEATSSGGQMAIRTTLRYTSRLEREVAHGAHEAGQLGRSSTSDALPS